MKRITLLFAAAMLTLSAIAYAAPSAVTDLIVTTGRTTAGVAFTAPTGAVSYEVKYWSSTMTSAGWGGYFFATSGSCTGGEQVCNTFSMPSCQSYYYSVRVYGGGWSDVSNQPYKTTKCPPNTTEVTCE
ncbi:MAG: hypothetical protein U0704_04845 [Candidatus Eisenbacteria bacterium]